MKAKTPRRKKKKPEILVVELKLDTKTLDKQIRQMRADFERETESRFASRVRRVVEDMRARRA